MENATATKKEGQQDAGPPDWGNVEWGRERRLWFDDDGADHTAGSVGGAVQEAVVGE
jgi:hypothetical protein